MTANPAVLRDGGGLAAASPLRDPDTEITTGGGQQGRPLAGGGDRKLTACATPIILPDRFLI
ncbi:MAG: hypothetical protein KBF17_14910 [Candidatus Promineofilum sp.]|nr:hypothetical protein [Promineifilum sp.]MBP9656179.1 hypothetical protein [Promineifilum sp.]